MYVSLYKFTVKRKTVNKYWKYWILVSGFAFLQWYQLSILKLFLYMSHKQMSKYIMDNKNQASSFGEDTYTYGKKEDYRENTPNVTKEFETEMWTNGLHTHTHVCAFMHAFR